MGSKTPLSGLLRSCPHEGFTVVDYTVTARARTLRVAYCPDKLNVTAASLHQYLRACATDRTATVEETVARIRGALTVLLHPRSLIIEGRARDARGTEMCVTTLRTRLAA